MSRLIVALFMATHYPAHTCVRGGGLSFDESHPCTAAQEQAQNKWFDEASKCWRGANVPGERQKCFDKIKPPLRNN
jgi:hypothetical protein